MIQLKKLPADLRRGSRSRFLSEPLEPRRLLSQYFAYVQVYSPLETTSGSNAISVAPGQSVTFNVSVIGEAFGGAGGPTPSGTVNLFETNTAGTVNQHATVTLVAQPNDVNGDGLATASATFTMADPNSTASGYVPFVYADYLGDANYDETLSTGGSPVNDGNVGNTVTVNFTAAANKLAFIQNPSDTAAGDTIKPPVTVAVEDSSGNIQTTATDSITLSLASSSTGTGTLAGTTTEAAVKGIATFSNLSINTGGNYTLTAADNTNTVDSKATSSSFNITAGKLVFLAPMLATTQTAGEPLQPTIKVELEDGSGNAITSEDGAIVTLAPIGFTADNPITGNTAALSGGIATFSKVKLTKPGTYQLQASDPDGDAMGLSNKFGIGGDKLKFLTQPKDSDVNQPLTMTVEAVDSKGKVDTTATDSVSLLLNLTNASSGAVLAGTTVEPLIRGVATFPASAAVAIGVPGSYTITAQAVDSTLSTDYSTTAATSNSFKITGLHLVVKSQPAKSSDQNVPIPFTVYLENAKNQLDTTDLTDTVQIALNTMSGGVGANLRGITAITLAGGVAKLTATAGPIITVPGVYTFMLSVPGSNTISSVDTAQFTVAGLHLAFVKVPHTVDIQTAFPFAVDLLDNKNKVVTTENTATVALGFNVVSSKATNPTLGGTVSGSFTNGVATFTASAGPQFSDPGIYTLTATETGVATGGAPVSSTLPGLSPNISATRFHLDLATAPKNANVNDALPLSVDVKASNNTIRYSENTDFLQVTLNTLAGGENAQLLGTTSIQLQGGSATFTNLSINVAGMYTLTITENDPSGQPSDATVPVTTKSFKIQGLHLAVLEQPTDVMPYDGIGLKFAIEDAQGKIDTDANYYFLAETLVPLTGTGQLLGAVQSFAVSGGVADLTGAPCFISDNAGTYEISASVTSLNSSAAPVEAVKTKPIRVDPLHLVIQQQPTTVGQFETIHTTVALEDPNGTVDTSDGRDFATLTLNNPGSVPNVNLVGSNLTYATSQTLQFQAGVINLSSALNPAASITTPVGVGLAGNYSLQFSMATATGLSVAPDPSSATTNTFTVSSIEVAVTQQPQNGPAGGQVAFQVQLETSSGTPITDLADSLGTRFYFTLQTLSGGSGAALSTPAAVTNANGTANFAAEAGFSISAPGTYQLMISFGVGGLVLTPLVTTASFSLT